MILQSSQTLLHHNIVQQIGADGMGVVWKNSDTDVVALNSPRQEHLQTSIRDTK